MLSDPAPSWSYHVEPLPSGAWCLRARSSAGAVLRYTLEGGWAGEESGAALAIWQTEGEALAAYGEPTILSDVWAEIDGEAPGWDVAARCDPFARPFDPAFDLHADPSSIVLSDPPPVSVTSSTGGAS